MAAPVPSTNSPAPWTTRRLLKWMHEHFASRKIDAPRLCAEMLLARAFDCDRMRLYMEAERPASEQERAMLRDFVRRVSEHEPVQYVVGEAWFFSRAFEVSPATLIPRPSTERLVEAGIDFLRARAAMDSAPARVLDLCTGTGCIAISIALAKGLATTMVATDISAAAIELAERNAARHGAAERIQCARGDLFAALTTVSTNARSSINGVDTRPFDLITANPPYVSDSEWDELEPNVRNYEPATALRGGSDGLDCVRRVIAEAPEWLVSGGLLLVEIGHAQRERVLAQARSMPVWRDPEVLDDYEGFHRVLRAERASR